jgi:hypothetical protein
MSRNVSVLPGETHPVHCTRGEVFHQYVGFSDQLFHDLFAFGRLSVHRKRLLVAIKLGEIQSVHIRNVTQLLARNITAVEALNFQHVCAEPGQQLRTRRTCRHACKVNYFDSFKR